MFNSQLKYTATQNERKKTYSTAMAALAGHTPVSNGLLAAIFLFNNRPIRHVTRQSQGWSLKR